MTVVILIVHFIRKFKYLIKTRSYLAHWREISKLSSYYYLFNSLTKTPYFLRNFTELEAQSVGASASGMCRRRFEPQLVSWPTNVFQPIQIWRKSVEINCNSLSADPWRSKQGVYKVSDCYASFTIQLWLYNAIRFPSTRFYKIIMTSTILLTIFKSEIKIFAFY